jgi:hypothetical protein
MIRAPQVRNPFESTVSGKPRVSNVFHLPRIEMPTIAPFADWLVVDVHIWLCEKSLETIGDPEIDRRRLAISCPSRTPKIHRSALILEASDLGDNSGDGNALRPDRASQRVVHINEDGKWLRHSISRARPYPLS